MPAKVLAQKDVKQADKLFNSFEYSLALAAYKDIVERGEPKLEYVQRIADSYRLMNNSKEAEFWYAQVVAFPEAEPASYYFYAEAAKRNGNYERAKSLFSKYGERVPEKLEVATLMAASCDTAMAWMKAPKSFDIQKENTLNSEGIDFSPTKLPDGMVFSSDRLSSAGKKKQQTDRYNWTGNGYVQLYFAPSASDSTWEGPVPLPEEVNTAFHNGPASFLGKENLLFFTRTNSVRRKGQKRNTDPTSWFKGDERSDYINRLEIYTAQRKGNEWVSVKPFQHNNPEKYSVGHPAITIDGQTLYFASDMPGGFGESDIYYCERQADGSWGKPVNAGAKINTSGRESFPSIGADGNLYFSSDGLTGMGGLDVFRALGEKGKWAKIENLKYPLNSSHDDFGIHADSTGTKGWLSSNRMAENGFDDILRFEEVRVPCTLVGETIERITVKGQMRRKEVPVDQVYLQLFEENNGSLREIYSDSKGRFTFPIKAGLNYTIRGSKKGYLTQTVTLTPECLTSIDSVQVEMLFNRDTPNKAIVLENIYYDLDKFDIRPDAAKELDKLVRTLKDNPNITIELGSHTDSRESHRYNQMLSDLRAQSAVTYMVARGIERSRMKAKGYGETQLRNKCADNVSCSEEEHQWNRRTEFKILAK
ncbi:OmpA family protein [Pontibacter ruber]|nr:OmpA family protein [Pontibacter ruber]